MTHSKTSFRRWVRPGALCAALTLAIALPGWAQMGVRPNPEAPKTGRTRISHVLPDLEQGELLIWGERFGEEPQVLLGLAGGEFEELTVLTSADMAIKATLPVDDPGTYVLVVNARSGAWRTASTSFTLGAEGPEGPPGPAGPAGPEGAAGSPGLPGVLGVYQRTVTFTCPEDSEDSCFYEEIVAHCDEGDAATGGTVFALNDIGFTLVNSGYPYPRADGVMPRGWAAHPARFSTNRHPVLTVTAVCVDLSVS